MDIFEITMGLMFVVLGVVAFLMAFAIFTGRV